MTVMERMGRLSMPLVAGMLVFFGCTHVRTIGEDIDPETAYRDIHPHLKPQKIETIYLKTYNCEYENIYFHRLYYEPFTKRVLRLSIVTPGMDDTPSAIGNKMFYQVSRDGGETFDEPRLLIQKGTDYNTVHPIAPVTIPYNTYVSSSSAPIRASNGEIMCPFGYNMLDENNRKLKGVNKDWMFVRGAGVLIGTWTDNGTDIEWDLGETLEIDHVNKSTRGVFEATVAELKTPGHFLLVMRGSNAWKTELPGYKWKSISTDYCRTWTQPEPFTYSNGDTFFSPSSCSDLKRNTKNGRLYWIGNICPENPDGNDPRHPLILAEVDEGTCGLIKDSVAVIDDVDPGKGDTEALALSNYSLREDPETGHFIVGIDRVDPGKKEEYEARKWPRVYVEMRN